MKKIFACALTLSLMGLGLSAQDLEDRNLPSGYRTDGILPEEYVDSTHVLLGEEEDTLLESIRGKWKRPLYRTPDPQFAEDWAEIDGYEIPEWIKDAKFGMYTHWGVYSVPAHVGNTYIRNMYTPTARGGVASKSNERTYSHHVETYGDPTEFGYTDFIPMFKAEKYSGEDYVKLMMETGARFGGLGCVHHDGFLMWDSDVNRWNVGEMGPHRDLYGEFVEAARKAGFKTLASFHHARTWEFCKAFVDEDFYSRKDRKKLDLYDPANADFFWGMSGSRKYDVEEFARQWKAKIIEVTDRYEPDVLWFDGIQRTEPNSPEAYLVEALKHYLLSLTEKGREPVLCNKLPSGGKSNYCHFNFPENTGLPCYEGGRNMPPDVAGDWLTDRAISYPWGYVNGKVYKLTEDVHIHALADQVARGGIYLLSLTPMGSGEIAPAELAICRGIGDWLKVNGEAIYSTRRWAIPAEGPVDFWALNEEREGVMWNYKVDPSEGAIRFTRSKDGDTVYAILLWWPEENEVLIRSMKSGSSYLKHPEISSVELIGSDAVLEWEQTPEGLKVRLPAEKPCEHAYSLRIR